MKTVISTPFPSLYSTATALGVGKARVQKLEKLMNAIHQGRNVSSIRSLDVFRGVVGYKAAKKKMAGRRRRRR